jgi:hypothetical protein
MPSRIGSEARHLRQSAERVKADERPWFQLRRAMTSVLALRRTALQRSAVSTGTMSTLVSGAERPEDGRYPRLGGTRQRMLG